MNLARAVRNAAHTVDVPGAPRSLRLEAVHVSGGECRIEWSFRDPEQLPGDSRPGLRRVRGETRSRARSAAECWSAAQLDAARRYRARVDADWLPGEPYRRRVWSTEEAWQALLGYLRSSGAEVHERDGEIVAEHLDDLTVYRFDPVEWARFLNRITDQEPGPGGDLVPAALPDMDGLPLWAVDELTWANGDLGPVVGLVDGRLVRLGGESGTTRPGP
jgi:hypothetical protein